MLITLDLSLCQICDSRIGQLTLLTRLHSLSLPGCESVTDVGIAHLRELQKLTALDLQNCCKVLFCPLKDLSEGVQDDSSQHQAFRISHFLIELTRSISANSCEPFLKPVLRLVQDLLDFIRMNTSKQESKTCPNPSRSMVPYMIDWSMQITDKGIQSLTSLAALQALDVSGCVAITPRGFQYISSSFQGLRSLKLGGCSRMATVTDACLTSFSSLTALTSLDLAGCIDVTDAGKSP